MESVVVLEKPDVSSDQLKNETAECINTAERERREVLQSQRQQFDMALDEAVDGLQEAQQILHMLKIMYFAEETTVVAPTTRLKLQRASHHCNRLLSEVYQLLQPFSQELQALSAAPSHQK